MDTAGATLEMIKPGDYTRTYIYIFMYVYMYIPMLHTVT